MKELSPSPWQYAPQGDVDGDPRVDSLANAGTDHFVLDAEGNELACSPSESDARLMASAPDLLENLESLLDAFFQFMDKTDWGKSFLDASTIRKANTAPIEAQRAIAKAKGREV